MPRSINVVYQLPDSYIAIDLETTGLDSKWDSIIEVAAARVENGEVTETFESLINPGFAIDDFITELTGITNEMLEPAPTIEQVLPDYMAFIQRDILLGHYLCFDIRFLKAAAEALEIPFEHCKYVDTMNISRKLFPEWSHHRLRDLVENLHIEARRAHRAMADVLATKDSYEALRQAMRDKNITLEEISPARHGAYAKMLSIQDEAYEPDVDIMGKIFVFTGTMERMSRKDGMQRVLNAGGTCGDRVTQETNFLVLGNAGYSMALKGGKSSKHKNAEKLKLQGYDIEVISEDVFLQMLEPNKE